MTAQAAESPVAAPGGEPVVRVENVTHRYGKTVALDGISLDVPSGIMVGVVGPDGVGKSTLLALIAGSKKMQEGRVTVLDGDIADVRHRRAVGPRIAYMPQGLGKNLYLELSVHDNVDFMAQLFGLSPGQRQVRVKELLQATGLGPFGERPAGKLSGGMKQKVGLCGSLIHDPDLLILDEPTTGVDPLSRRQFWTLIDEIRAERPQMTLLVSTAYMDEAERFGRLVAVDDGRVLAQGPTADILAQAGAASLEEADVALQAGGAAQSRPPPFVIAPRSADDGQPAIVAEGLTRRFGDFTAVDHVSFNIGRGEIFGFLGSNGSGKTTTMKMLTGLLGVTEGRAELLGRPVEAGDLSTRLRVGYMSQSFSLYEELTVRANLLLPARLYRIPAAEIASRVADALQQFDLVEVADAKPVALPLGIRQRLQLAAACLHRPEVLILDEPTSGVDPAARDMFWRLLADLSRRDNVTIFVSTHFMNEAERCDRISLMHAGRVLVVGTPDQIREAKGAASLEEAFISYLETAGASTIEVLHAPQMLPGESQQPVTRRADWPSPLVGSLARMWAIARRETLEVLRDRVR